MSDLPRCRQLSEFFRWTLSVYPAHRRGPNSRRDHVLRDLTHLMVLGRNRVRGPEHRLATCRHASKLGFPYPERDILNQGRRVLTPRIRGVLIS